MSKLKQHVNKLAIRKISRSQFQRAISTIELHPRQSDRALRVLVNGQSIKEVAASEELTYESVRSVVARVLAQVDLPKLQFSDKQLAFAFEKMPRMTEQSRLLVRRVLVKGEAASDVAASAGISLATLSQKVNRVKEAILPVGWRFVSGALPAEDAAVVEGMFKKALTKFHD